MMVVTRRHARPESPREVRRKLYRAAEAEIGSRVFPLPAPTAPPPPMPSVGARRSTRVFLPKASSVGAAANSCGNDESRVLRSGKRLALSKSTDEWLEDFGNGGTTELQWWKEREKRETGGSAVLTKQEDIVPGAGGVLREFPNSDFTNDSFDPPEEKKFAIVYERKRQRQLSDDGAVPSSSSTGDVTSDSERRFGLVYVRKGRRKRFKVTSLPERIKESPFVEVDHVEGSKEIVKRELGVTKSVANFAKEVGVREDSLCTSIGGRVVLLLLVEPSCTRSSLLLSRLLTALLRWSRRGTRTVREFATFILSGSLASVFSQQGVHMLPLRWHSDNLVFKNTVPSCGRCKIYGARQSVTVMWLNFLALPSYFRSLHVSMLLGSLYCPRSIARCLMCLKSCTHFSVGVNSERNDYHPLVEAGYLKTEPSEIAFMEWQENANTNAYKLNGHNTIILNGSRLSKHRRKRSFSRSLRSRNLPFTRSHANPLLRAHSNRNGGITDTLLEAKANVIPEVMMRPIFIEVPDVSAEESLSCKDESDVSTPLSAQVRQRRSVKKSPVEQSKEIRSALAKVKLNIDSVHCKANVLVTDADRCWREEGFQIMLEMIASQEWCIAIKFKDEVKYLHRPLEMRPCVVNRFTHAYMWAGEDRWKLEFLDRWDWLVFKELHMECRERNVQEASLRMIPVPVYKEVTGYEEDTEATFIRPDEYIRVEDDEVQRALSNNIVKYDMDSGDEQWLTKYNSSNPHAETGEEVDLSQDLLRDDFERIIYSMEKDAYSNVDDVFDTEKAVDHYQHFENREMLISIYEYWIKKRAKRHAPLVREFQGPPLRKAQLVHKPFLRKKRSLKRQRSQTARTKPVVVSQVGIDEGALQRVQEAENASKRAIEYAIQLRRRAQVLMTNAELAVYKSVMALRIADSMEASMASDFTSLFLD
ncbi:hypothetical protein Cni_G25535 [Canna indica]|uniref:Enhancer of polycomb-like protein n=1 Tax=Canna indica TaxID=4628 RepID=A0AAQ3L066_9LILI|nr:hypothetical protein Cni_G25535 [Canna indica]